jgi:hypothetical protein
MQNKTDANSNWVVVMLATAVVGVALSWLLPVFGIELPRGFPPALLGLVFLATQVSWYLQMRKKESEIRKLKAERGARQKPEKPDV